jgi:hypothetical protein
MNYIYDSFLSPLEQSDKTIKILDIDGILKYISIYFYKE